MGLNLGKLDNANKIYFIHFNHTNPALWDGKVVNEILEAGFNVSNSDLVLDL